MKKIIIKLGDTEFEKHAFLRSLLVKRVLNFSLAIKMLKK